MLERTSGRLRQVYKHDRQFSYFKNNPLNNKCGIFTDNRILLKNLNSYLQACFYFAASQHVFWEEGIFDLLTFANPYITCHWANLLV